MAKVYKKIPGMGSGRGRAQPAMRSRIYSGPDHLLVVQSTGYTEEYKRIFYRDIRYVEVRRNRAQLWQAIFSGSLMGFLLLILILVRTQMVVFAVLSFPLFIWFMINLFRGSTCDCYISTSVQTLLLPAPSRKNKVPKLIQFLRTQTEAIEPVAPEQPTA
jgi:uncharacterized integral membrane protein